MKRELNTQIADISGELATVKLARKTLNAKATKQAGRLAIKRKAKAILKSELSKKTSELTEEKIVNRSLRGQLRDLRMGLVRFKGNKVAINAAIDETADTLGKRAQKSAVLEIALMSGEALPYLGTTVIMGVTALEIIDLYVTLKDMSAHKRAFNPSFQQSDEELEYCSIKVPPKQDIVGAIKTSPKKAWVAAKEALPTVDELKEMKISDVDWSEVWGKTMEGDREFLHNASEGMSSF